MARPTRTPLQRELDLTRIASLYLAGKTQAEIAAEFELSQPQISYDLKILQDRWVKSSQVLINKAKAHELAKLDNLEREYWAGYLSSQKEFRGTSTEKNKGGRYPGTKVSIKKERRVGDPRFLDGVKGCIERRCKIIGLDAPTKSQISLDKLTNDELINIITGKT